MIFLVSSSHSQNARVNQDFNKEQFDESQRWEEFLTPGEGFIYV